MTDVRVFVSYDPVHDRGLYDLILAQSRMQSSGFSIVGSSERDAPETQCSEKTALSIREASQMIIICGEHSESSASMTAELKKAEQGRQALLLDLGAPRAHVHEARGSQVFRGDVQLDDADPARSDGCHRPQREVEEPDR